MFKQEDLEAYARCVWNHASYVKLSLLIFYVKLALRIIETEFKTNFYNRATSGRGGRATGGRGGRARAGSGRGSRGGRGRR